LRKLLFAASPLSLSAGFSLWERRSSACSCRVRSHSFSRIFSPLSLLIGAEFLAPSNSSNAASGKHLPFSAINNITARSRSPPFFRRRAPAIKMAQVQKIHTLLCSLGWAVLFIVQFTKKSNSKFQKNSIRACFSHRKFFKYCFLTFH
jgi:hypothetical protein